MSRERSQSLQQIRMGTLSSSGRSGSRLPARLLALPAALLACAVVGGVGSTARADGRFTPYQGEPQQVTVQSLIPRVIGDESYYEQYNFEATLDGGKPFYLRLRIANLGPGDGRMEVTVRGQQPQSGKRFKYGKKLSRDDWSYQKDRFEIKAGRTSVHGTPEAIEVQGSDKGCAFALRFERQAEGWRPGNGVIRFGGDGYYATSIIFPRALVKGTITTDGKVEQVKGTGFAIHSHSNRAPYQLARRWVQFDSHDSDYAIYLREFVPARGYPQRPVSWLLITYQDRIVFQSSKVSVRAEQTRPDEKTEARYLMPQRLVFTAEAPGQTVRGVLEGTELYLRSAMLEEAGMLERAVIKRVAEPVDYNYRCTYKLELENAGSPPVEIAGRATYSVNYLNK